MKLFLRDKISAGLLLSRFLRNLLAVDYNFKNKVPLKRTVAIWLSDTKSSTYKVWRMPIIVTI